VTCKFLVFTVVPGPLIQAFIYGFADPLFKMSPPSTWAYLRIEINIIFVTSWSTYTQLACARLSYHKLAFTTQLALFKWSSNRAMNRLRSITQLTGIGILEVQSTSNSVKLRLSCINFYNEALLISSDTIGRLSYECMSYILLFHNWNSTADNTVYKGYSVRVVELRCEDVDSRVTSGNPTPVGVEVRTSAHVSGLST
jgi:hypothetical protein